MAQRIDQAPLAPFGANGQNAASARVASTTTSRAPPGGASGLVIAALPPQNRRMARLRRGHGKICHPEAESKSWKNCQKAQLAIPKPGDGTQETRAVDHRPNAHTRRTKQPQNGKARRHLHGRAATEAFPKEANRRSPARR